MQATWVWSLGREDLLEKEMATHSSILAWRIPWMKEPGELQSTWSKRVGHDWATSLSFLLRISPGGEHGNPLQYSCLENPMERILWTWWAAVHGVIKSQTPLKQLSMHTQFPRVRSKHTFCVLFLFQSLHISEYRISLRKQDGPSKILHQSNYLFYSHHSSVIC